MVRGTGTDTGVLVYASRGSNIYTDMCTFSEFVCLFIAYGHFAKEKEKEKVVSVLL